MYARLHAEPRGRPHGHSLFTALCLALLILAATRVAGAQAPGDSVTAAPQTSAPAATPAPQAGAPATPAAPQAAGSIRVDAGATASAADSLPDADGGWPRLIICPSGATLVLYQPQVLSWKDQRHMVAMAAVSYTPKGTKKADLGTIRLESPTSTSVQDRMVNFVKVDVAAMNFPSLEKLETQEVLTEIKKSLPQENVLIALDRILAAVDTSQISVKGVKINTEPPPIFYSTKPAILVQFDGELIMAPIDGTSLKYVVNTNWDVFLDGDTKLYYLRNNEYWLQTPDLAKWEPVQKLPGGFEKLANDDNWKDVKANIPGKKISKSKMPIMFVSKTPSELILVDGSPKYEKVKDTKLEWVKNTESDVFRFKDKKKKEHYVLLSGRWFRTEKMEKGPWAFATADLPPDFAKIPQGHDRAKALKAPDVKYDGDPKFKPIPGTSVSYAENTAYDVLQVGGAYYLCFQGVWFKSESATGPFVVTTKVPAEIYAIPSDSPAQHVTYVTVIDDDENYPTYGYTAGYVGVSVAFGCAMWGTGYYYPPYYHYGPGYPAYYPRPVAYGCGASYNPWTGAYGGYQAAYGPYGGVARGASYNPSTGTYARGGMAWGPGGAQGYAQAYNPRTGTAASTRQGSNVYGSWGSTTVKRGDNWVNSQRVTDSHGNTKWKAQGSGGGAAAGFRGEQGSGFVGQSGSGDIYAGKDGNVYRKTDSGWQQHQEGGGWNDVGGGQGGDRPGGGNSPSQQPAGGQRPSQQPSASTQPAQRPSTGASPSTGQLDRDSKARSQGAQQTRNYDSYQRSGGTSSRSSSAPRGGGGSRGGGGRRR